MKTRWVGMRLGLLLALGATAIGQQVGGGGAPGAGGSGGGGSTAPTKVSNGVGYSRNYTGSTLDVRVNACIVDAETLANGNTSGICDSGGEGGVQTIAAPINVGDSAGDPVTWRLPNSCTWSDTASVLSNASAIMQYSHTSIVGPSQNWLNCQIINGSGNGQTNAVYQTVPATGGGYYKAEGFALVDYSYATTSGAVAVISDAIDTSIWKNIAILAYNGGENGLLISNATSSCCSSVFENLQINMNSSGNIPLDIEGGNAGSPQALVFTNSTFTHPGTGQPLIKCNDVSTNKGSSVWFTGIYEETGTTDTTTALNQITGCGSVLFHGLTIADPYTVSSAPAITVGTSTPTSLDVSSLTMYAGFSKPTTAIVNNATSETIGTTGGYLTSYHSNGDYATRYNGLGLTANAAGFSIAGGTTAKTLSVANTMTLAGADGATYTLSNLAPLTAPAFTGAATAAGFFPQARAAGPYTVLFDDYYSGANNASNNIGTPTGASCGVNTTYTDSNHPGNILLTSGTGGTGTGITCGYQSESPDVVAPNSATLGWTWETAVYVPVLPGTTAGSYQAGLTNGPNVNPWTTGIHFYLSSANAVANDWYCRYGSTSTDSTVAATAATWTRLTMQNDGTFVHWYINGTEATGCKTVVGSVPSGNQYPASWAAAALSASSVTMSVDYVDFQRATAR